MELSHVDRGRITERRRPVLALAAALACVGAVFVVRAMLHRPSRVVSVSAGSRLLGVSHGVATWMDQSCKVRHAYLDGGHPSQPSGPFLAPDGCPADDPRFDGSVVYFLGRTGLISRQTPDRGTVLLERPLAYALALDSAFLYVGNCHLQRDCRIERLAVDGSGQPVLIRAGILTLANMEVDERDLFWVDRGADRPDCHQDVSGERIGPMRCSPPVPSRLMAAPKDRPRAIERVVRTNFDGRRLFLGSRHVYWLGTGGVHLTPKTGGPDQLVLPASALTGFASDGDEVYLATDAGIFTGRDGERPHALELTSTPPLGLGLEGRFVYWVDSRQQAIVRRRR